MLTSLLDRLLKRNTTDTSKQAAKDRLRLVLMHDRSDIPATMMEAIRADLIQMLSKYVEIDTAALEVQLDREAGEIGLSLNIPIRRVKSEAEAEEAMAAAHALQAAAGRTLDSDSPAPLNGNHAEPAPRTEEPETREVSETTDRDTDRQDTEADDEPTRRNTGDLVKAITGDLLAERAEPSD